MVSGEQFTKRGVLCFCSRKDLKKSSEEELSRGTVFRARMVPHHLLLQADVAQGSPPPVPTYDNPNQHLSTQGMLITLGINIGNAYYQRWALFQHNHER